MHGGNAALFDWLHLVLCGLASFLSCFASVDPPLPPSPLPPPICAMQALHAVKRLAGLPQFHGVLIQYAMEPLCTAIIPLADVAAAKVGVRVLVKLASEPRNLKKMTTLEV